MPFITAVRTIRIAKRANIIWVEIETGEGLKGTLPAAPGIGRDSGPR